MKRQQKLSSFFTQKRMAVEPEIEKHEDGLDKDGEAGEVSSKSQPPELQEPTASSSTSNTVKRNQNREKHKNYNILVIVWMMSVFQSFNIIV